MTAPTEFPPVLACAVHHAETLAALLSTTVIASRGDVWAIGRSDEIGCLLELVTADWRSGSLGESAAAEEIGAYLDVLYQGLSFHLAEPAGVSGSAPHPDVFFAQESTTTGHDSAAVFESTR